MTRIGTRKCSKLLDKERELLNSVDITPTKGCLVGLGFSSLKRSYLRDYFGLIDELVDAGANKDDAQNCIPLFVTRKTHNPHHGVAFFALKRSSPLRKKMFDYFFNCAVNKRFVTRPGMKESSKTEISEWSCDDYETHYTPQSAHYALEYLRTHQTWCINKQQLQTATKTHDDQILNLTYDLTTKIGYFKRACSTPQYLIYQQMVDKGIADNVYAAFVIGSRWVSEKLEVMEATS